MNEYDVQRATHLYEQHPVLGPATKTLSNLLYWTNCNSDGWAYWPKPTRAAARLMELIEPDGVNPMFDRDRADATLEKYRAACRPIKAFRTRQSADFEIVELA
jgi:hypothetical protein